MRKGFSLIELVVTMAVIAVIAVLAVYAIKQWRERNSDSGFFQDNAVAVNL